MKHLLRDLWQEDAGMILSAELVIILTVAVIGMVVGLVNLQNAILGEFADISLAFQSLNQSYSTPSFRGCWKFWGRTSWTAGSTFIDVFDGCVGSGPCGNYGCDINGAGGCLLPNVATATTVVEPAIAVPPALPAPTAQPTQPTQQPCDACQD